MRKKRTFRQPGPTGAVPMEEALMGFAAEVLRGPIKPVTVMVGVGALVGAFAVGKYVPSLKSALGRLLAQMTAQMTAQANLEIARLELEAASARVAAHPEAQESRTAIDERQLGRSEVINEIARGKPN